jgi:ribosomal protein L11 methyltransferase
MKWQEVVLTTTNEAAEAAANIFFDVGFKGVVIEDPNIISRYIEEDKWDCYDIPRDVLSRDMVVIKGYLPVDNQLSKRMKCFRDKVAGLEKYFEDYSADISIEEIMEEDWSSSWKRYYKATKIGKRLVIKPQWEDYQTEPGEIVIDINPGTAFGTGTHPTTIMCLKFLEKYLKQGQVVFDVGCGSGILSIAAVKLGAKYVYARDIDSVAVKVTRRNSILNGVEDQIVVEAGNFLNEVYTRAHLILSNLIADSIVEFTPQAYEKLFDGGILIASGIINNRAEEVIREMRCSGFTILETCIEGDWVTVIAERK